MKKLFILLSILVAASCAQPQAHTFGAAGGTSSPIIPASWTVAAWFIDPANSSGTASDSNNCTTSATACLTWHEINDHRWGCQGTPAVCPRFQQNTAIEFLSSQSTDADPVYFRPAIENGVIVQIFGQLGAGQQIASGVLSNVTAKNRSTPQLLLAQSGATAPQQFVINSTHPSRAWTYKLSSGSIYSMTEPSTAASTSNVCGTPVDTWANGDSVVVYQPVAVNISDVRAIWEESNGTVQNSTVFIYNIAITKLAGGLSNFTNTTLGQTAMIESSANNFVTPTSTGTVGSTYCNASINRGIKFGTPLGFLTFNGGSIDTQASGSQMSNTLLNNDVILGGSIYYMPSISRRAGSTIVFAGGGPAYIDTAQTLAMETSFDGTQGIWWGPGTINVIGTGRFSYTSPAATNLIVGTLQLNGGTTGNSMFTLANVNTPCGGITVNKANLDAAASATCATTGFGGLAFNYGGGEFVATSTVGF